jgi:serine/threonine-protein kinase
MSRLDLWAIDPVTGSDSTRTVVDSPPLSPGSLRLGPGALLGGKYRIEKLLAEGGMGTVWLARHADINRAVAIKVMDPGLAASPKGRARFLQEARAVARVRSPHIVDIWDYGVDGDLPYIVMELLEGEDLSERLSRQRRIPPAAAAKILVEVARALDLAHRSGLIHRDLKPENIFLAQSDDGRGEIAKILDFGIAKDVGPGAEYEPTSTGVVIGTPHYMSPEQVRGDKCVDHRSDLWSLGVVLFQAITGHKPFNGESFVQIADAILTEPLSSCRDLAPDLPPGLDEFFRRALARRREARFQSALEMAGALSAVLPQPPPAPGEAFWQKLALWFAGAITLVLAAPPAALLDAALKCSPLR